MESVLDQRRFYVKIIKELKKGKNRLPVIQVLQIKLKEDLLLTTYPLDLVKPIFLQARGSAFEHDSCIHISNIFLIEI